MNLKNWILILFLTFLNFSFLHAQFTDITPDSLPGVYNGDISLGDFDNDGDLDILTAGINANHQLVTHIFKNNEGILKNIEIQQDTLPGVFNGKAEWADLNGDGLLDIFLAGNPTEGGNYEGWIAIYLNTGDSFQIMEDTGLPLLEDIQAELTDFDADNDIDLLISFKIDEQKYGASVYINDGNCHFSKVSDFYNEGEMYATMTTSTIDFNGDGLSDLMINTVNNGGWNKIYLNTGKNYNFLKNPSSPKGGKGASPKWADFNNDGQLDLISNYTKKGETYLYSNNSYHFLFGNTPHETISGLVKGIYQWGDYDLDGDQDIFTAGVVDFNTDERVSTIYQNNMGNFLEIPNLEFAKLKDNSMEWGDIDNDGDLDVIMTGRDINDSVYFKVYQNDIGGNNFMVNKAPTSPINLVDSIVGNTLFMSWDFSSDDHTTTSGLTYDYIVLSEDSSIVLGSSFTDINSGKLKMEKPGIINGAVNHWKVSNLPSGKYRWGIQAIDASFKASPIAFSDPFEIVNKPPSDFKVKEVKPNKVELSWKDNSDIEEGYFLERKAPGDTTFLFINKLPIDATSFIDYSVEGNKTYNYRITIANDFGKSGSEELSVKTPASNYLMIKQNFEHYIYSSNIGDYDQDGILDLLSSGRILSDTAGKDEDVTKLHSLDTSTFIWEENPIYGITGGAYGSTKWIDFDNDGDLDISVSGLDTKGSIFFELYENLGNNNFQILEGSNLPSIGIGASEWGDFDNDGDLDVFITGRFIDSFNEPSYSYIYKNNGNKTFSKLSSTNFLGVTQSQAKWIDLDNDGLKDLVYCGEIRTPLPNGGSISTRVGEIHKNIGGDEFEKVVLVEFDNVKSFSIGDYNADNLPDILVSYIYESKGQTVLFDNHGYFEFEKNHTRNLDLENFNTVYLEDLNSDSKLDAIFLGGEYTSVYLNEGEEGFKEDDSLAMIGGNGRLLFNDFDNDGDKDFAHLNASQIKYLDNFASSGNVFSHIYLNPKGTNKFQKNTAPTPPSDLTHKVLGNQLELSWSGATDEQSPVASLTYNLEIRKGDSIIWSSQSLENGSQLIPDAGNMGHNTKLIMDSLAYGNYKWRIQAIDPSYGASPFSEWKALEITKQFKITGSLLIEGGDPVNQGTVEVHQTSGDSINLVKSISLANANTFEFEGEENGKYIIKAIPDSISFPDLTPTFYGNKLTLEDAEIIELSKDTAISITIQPKPISTYKTTGTLITQNGDPVNQGAIEVYQTSDDSTNLVKSISITDSNTFVFEGEKDGGFILKAIPDSENHPNLLPTYFGDVLLFNEAKVIELSEDKLVTITLFGKTGEQTGSSTLEGLALETKGNEGGRLSQGFATEGTPIPDLPIYLLNKEKALVDLDTTDSNGLFKFENINSGEYQLAADYNNKPLSVSNSLFEITENGQSLQLSLLVGDSLSVEITSITGLEDFEPIEGVSIYPNPVENVIQVNIQNQINGNYELEILDITGKSLIKQRLKKSNQNMVESIDLVELTKGIYFLKIRKGNTLVVKRLVKG